MAPEQLEGAEIDARTDIFSLGALLYETFGGGKAFEGNSQGLFDRWHYECDSASALAQTTLRSAGTGSFDRRLSQPRCY
jgi:serine/threonine protein kinase